MANLMPCGCAGVLDLTCSWHHSLSSQPSCQFDIGDSFDGTGDIGVDWFVEAILVESPGIPPTLVCQANVSGSSCVAVSNVPSPCVPEDPDEGCPNPDVSDPCNITADYCIPFQAPPVKVGAWQMQHAFAIFEKGGNVLLDEPIMFLASGKPFPVQGLGEWLAPESCEPKLALQLGNDLWSLASKFVNGSSPSREEAVLGRLLTKVEAEPGSVTQEELNATLHAATAGTQEAIKALIAKALATPEEVDPKLAAAAKAVSECQVVHYTAFNAWEDGFIDDVPVLLAPVASPLWETNPDTYAPVLKKAGLCRAERLVMGSPNWVTSTGDNYKALRPLYACGEVDVAGIYTAHRSTAEGGWTPERWEPLSMDVVLARLRSVKGLEVVEVTPQLAVDRWNALSRAEARKGGLELARGSVP
jgi:hypothetical protein